MTYPSCIQNPSAGILLALILMLAVSCSEEDCPTCPPSEDPVPTGWFVQETPTTESLGNLQVLNNLTVVAIGSAGTILRTGDGGDIWTPIPSGSGKICGMSFSWMRPTAGSSATMAWRSGVPTVVSLGWTSRFPMRQTFGKSYSWEPRQGGSPATRPWAR